MALMALAEGAVAAAVLAFVEVVAGIAEILEFFEAEEVAAAVAEAAAVVVVVVVVVLDDKTLAVVASATMKAAMVAVVVVVVVAVATVPIASTAEILHPAQCSEILPPMNLWAFDFHWSSELETETSTSEAVWPKAARGVA